LQGGKSQKESEKTSLVAGKMGNPEQQKKQRKSKSMKKRRHATKGPTERVTRGKGEKRQTLKVVGKKKSHMRHVTVVLFSSQILYGTPKIEGVPKEKRRGVKTLWGRCRWHSLEKKQRRLNSGEKTKTHSKTDKRKQRRGEGLLLRRQKKKKKLVGGRGQGRPD